MLEKRIIQLQYTMDGIVFGKEDSERKFRVGHIVIVFRSGQAQAQSDPRDAMLTRVLDIEKLVRQNPMLLDDRFLSH